jgi:hypothetical protein
LYYLTLVLPDIFVSHGCAQAAIHRVLDHA